jgi:MoxR-like ATPase
MERLNAAVIDDKELKTIIRDFSSPRYQEGYEKGIHDEDCAKLLSGVLPVLDEAGLLAYGPKCRALANVFWVNYGEQKQQQSWLARAHSAQQLSSSLSSNSAVEVLKQEIHKAMQEFLQRQPLPFSAADSEFASEYLAKQLAIEPLSFVSSRYGNELAQGLLDHLEKIGHRQQYLQAIENLTGSPCEQWLLTEAWLNGFVQFHQRTEQQRFVPEAVAILVTGDKIDRSVSSLDLQIRIEKLMGEHPTIKNRGLTLYADEFLERLNEYMTVGAKQFAKFHKLRQQVVEQERKQLRLHEFKPRPLTSFVRNKLINEAYLPIVGDNLAKQMGSVGENKRTDLMGLLLLISPPGYGKTTLMEYIASRLGLIFMKVNCPALGHEVRSIDPANAPNATARQELEKLNLALEMGNNVMLYLDDIQHTHPEFLQKFISLCDATRRIEGVWQGQSKTYDLRGKKFCVVMAGNPYTESGEVFKIPDMLANRADVYNLGDILSGQENVFALSYIENALTSNPVLAPLALRDMEDVYKLIRMAKGENIPATDLSHTYSAAEINEIIDVLQKLFKVQDVILKVNQAYIASAASSDKYRTEPPFKLQGSYRNMNKMAEKIVSIMDEQELQDLINDHYMGEAQLLTTGAEENLLKLAELRGAMSESQKPRWDTIKKDYQRLKSVGGDDMDAAAKVVNQMTIISERLQHIGQSLEKERDLNEPFAALAQQIGEIKTALAGSKLDVKVINEPLPGLEKAFAKLADTIDHTFMPVVQSMNHKINLDLNILKKVSELSADLRKFTGSKTAKTEKQVKLGGEKGEADSL